MNDHNNCVQSLGFHVSKMFSGPCESISTRIDEGGLSQFGAAVSAKQPLKLKRSPHRREVEREKSKTIVSAETNHIGPFMHLLRPLHLQETLPEGRMLDAFVNQQRQLIVEGCQPELVLGKSDIDLDLVFVVAVIDSDTTTLNRCATRVAMQHGSLGVPETCGLVVLLTRYLRVRLPAETRRSGFSMAH